MSAVLLIASRMRVCAAVEAARSASLDAIAGSLMTRKACVYGGAVHLEAHGVPAGRGERPGALRALNAPVHDGPRRLPS